MQYMMYRYGYASPPIFVIMQYRRFLEFCGNISVAVAEKRLQIIIRFVCNYEKIVGYHLPLMRSMILIMET